MRVLIVHNRYQSRWPSGEDMVVDAEADLLRRYGHDVRLWQRHSDDISGSLGLVRAAGSTIHSRRAQRELGAEIRRFAPDVVHLHSVFPLISPSIIHTARGGGRAVVATLHNYRLMCPAGTFLRDGLPCHECVERTPARSVVHGCYRRSRLATLPVAVSQAWHEQRRTWHGVHRFICPSSFARGHHEQLGFDPGRLVVKPHFIDPFPAAAAHHDGPVTYVGRIDEAKGCQMLLDAWETLPGVPLRLVGSGPLAADLAFHPATRKGSIEFTGQVPFAAALEMIAAARMIVMPSLTYETFSLAIRDAMATGKAVVAPRQGAAAELIEHDVTGLLYEAGSLTSLRDAVLELIDDPARLNRLGTAARLSAEQTMAAGPNVTQLAAIYASALEEART